MDDEWQHVLYGESLIAFVDLCGVYLSTDKDELYDDDGGEVHYPTRVVVEKE